jgi:endoglucanase
LTVSGNQLIGSNGKPMRLLGVNMFMAKNCLIGKSQPFPAPLNGATVSALAAWHVNSVRIVISENCWLGLDGGPRKMTSAAYRQSIQSFVALLNSAHIYVILALEDYYQTAKSSNKKGYSTSPLLDAANGPAFLTSLATAFKDSPDVMFDVYGEPGLITWSCWLNGCTSSGIQYIGMQQIVDIVRHAGARQILLLGGVIHAENLGGWISHEPIDPDHELVASVAVYQNTECGKDDCWNSSVASTARHVPVVTTEVGDSTCSTSFLQDYMSWADQHGLSYLAWAWRTGKGTCKGGGALLANYSGTASAYGEAFENHLAELYKSGGGDVGAVAPHS